MGKRTTIRRMLGEGTRLSEASKDPADESAALIDKGQGHFVFKDIDKKRDELNKALVKAKKELDGQRRIGMGETEAQTLLKVVVLPALQAYAQTVTKVYDAANGVANVPRRY
jgi:hypothetical protein